MPSVAIIGTRGYPSYYGGFETAVRKLAPYLVDAGWEVTVYARPGTTSLEDPQRDPRVKVVTTKGVQNKSLSTLTFGLTSTIDAIRKKHDVALVMNVANGLWFPFLKLARIPTLTNVDGIEWDRAKWGKIAKLVFRTGAKLTAVFGNQLVYDAQEIAKRWKTEFGRDGYFIPYGGDQISNPLALEAGLEHRNYILVVARFVPENSIPEFLAAAPILSRTIDVVIVGSSGYGGELDELARTLSEQHENIHWLGHVSDDSRLHSLWQHAALYFHGHSVGGTNPALVQAMACGSPILARDTPYNREVLGDQGAYVSADFTQIVDVALSMLVDKEQLDLLGSLNMKRADDHYSWTQVCAAYESALRELLS